MSEAPDQRMLVQRAMELRERNPDGWNALVAEMERYTSEMTRRMLSCAPEMLLRAQGMAMGANELTVIFKTAPKLHQKFQDMAHDARQRG